MKAVIPALVALFLGATSMTQPAFAEAPPKVSTISYLKHERLLEEKFGFTRGFRTLGQPRSYAFLDINRFAKPTKRPHYRAPKTVTAFDNSAKRTRNAGAFGSTPIPFNAISSLNNWKKVYAEIQNYGAGKITKVGFNPAKAGDLSFFEKLELINSRVNNLITYTSDENLYGRMDYWAGPSETIRRRFGDCEDYVILKMALLKEMGVPTTAMSMIVLRDTSRNLYHAVLAINTNKGTLILDNLNQNVVFDSQLPQYLPLFSFNESRSYLHGWHKDSPRKLLARKSLAKPGAILPGGDGKVKSIRIDQSFNNAIDNLLPVPLTNS